jgi:hypothetical protein
MGQVSPQPIVMTTSWAGLSMSALAVIGDMSFHPSTKAA